MKNISVENSVQHNNQKVFITLSTLFLIFFIFLITTDAQNLDVPFVPTSEKVVELMLDVVDIGPDDYVIDLGSGDGRIVIAAAKRGAVGHGIDIDPKRIEEAKANAAKADVEDRVLFIQEDLFKTDFSRASVVTMYLLNSVNRKLRPHLLQNLKPGTRIVSHDFDMDDWKPDKHMQEGYDDVFFWVIPASVEGNWRWKNNGSNFSMNVKQKYQEIEISAKSGNADLKVEDSKLTGDRIRFSVTNPSDKTAYVFSGRIEDGNIEGLVQIRKGENEKLEKWDATRN